MSIDFAITQEELTNSVFSALQSTEMSAGHIIR